MAAKEAASTMKQRFLTWTKEFAVGHSGLDAEHRQLLDAINRVCSAEYAGCAAGELRQLLEQLTISAVEHFKHENTLLRELGCLASALREGVPDARNIINASTVNEHCAEHARALLRLEAIVQTLDGDTKSNRESLGEMLMDWFTGHAVEHDADLRDGLQVYLTHARDAAAWG